MPAPSRACTALVVPVPIQRLPSACTATVIPNASTVQCLVMPLYGTLSPVKARCWPCHEPCHLLQTIYFRHVSRERRARGHASWSSPAKPSRLDTFVSRTRPESGLGRLIYAHIRRSRPDSGLGLETQVSSLDHKWHVRAGGAAGQAGLCARPGRLRGNRLFRRLVFRSIGRNQALTVVHVLITILEIVLHVFLDRLKCLTCHILHNMFEQEELLGKLASAVSHVHM